MSSSSETQIITSSRTCIFTDKLVPDIRFIIYNMLIAEAHEIEFCTWSQYVSNPGILGPLSEACRKTRREIEEWYRTKSRAGLERSKTFGIFNPRTTIFWRRMFPFNFADVEYPVPPDAWQTFPVDQSTMAPFARRRDIRTVPNESHLSSTDPRELVLIHARHDWHWRLLKKGYRPTFTDALNWTYTDPNSE